MPAAWKENSVDPRVVSLDEPAIRVGKNTRSRNSWHRPFIVAQAGGWMAEPVMQRPAVHAERANTGKAAAMFSLRPRAWSEMNRVKRSK
jgi:hypothetical protein